MNGALFAALALIKIQMIGPYIAAAALLLGVALARRVAWATVWQIVLSNLVGFSTVSAITVGVLAAAGNLRAGIVGYAAGKVGGLPLRSEFTLELAFARALARSDVPGAIVLGLSALLLLLALLARRYRTFALFALIGLLLSTWAALIGVRHPYSFFIPRAYVAVALPVAVALMRSRLLGYPLARSLQTVAVIALALVLCVPALRDARVNRALLDATPSIRCENLGSNSSVQLPQATAAGAFAQWIRQSTDDSAQHGVMSYDFGLGAEVDRLNHAVAAQKFTFISGWSPGVLRTAQLTQRQYVETGAVDWVWVLLPAFDPQAPVEHQVMSTKGMLGATYSASLFARYVPVLPCGTNILFQAR